MAEDGLPASFIKKLVKAKLAELGGSDKGEVALQKEAVAAFGEAAKIFIHYLTFTANEFCHEAKRSTINAEDVLKAVEEIEFSEFLEPLRESLAGFKAVAAEKKLATKRKAGDGEAAPEEEAPEAAS